MLTYIKINEIKRHINNPRKDLGDLTELAESIKANGILQNLTVVPRIMGSKTESGPWQDGYTVVIGHRRLAAAKIAGLAEVPCIISNMSEKEQIATMLLENMQRNDLTVYEQAQGFQMMLNFGESINDIAEMTGFSEATVRRRVKLLELDQEKFEKSVVRGGTLQDYAELNKIEDIELRNSVLDKIGTSNFNWELSKAIDKEKRDKNKALIVAELEKFATQVEDNRGLQIVKNYYASESDITIPDDAGIVKYFFIVSDYGYIGLYKESTEPKPTIPLINEEEKEMIQKRRTGLQELSKRAYEFRRDFIKSVRDREASVYITIIAKFLINDVLLDDYFDLDNERFADFIGAEAHEAEDGDLQWDFSDPIMDQPSRSLLVAAWLCVDSENQNYWSWNLGHTENQILDKLYDLLRRMGYEMSDEERQLQDGTHELFAVKE